MKKLSVMMTLMAVVVLAGDAQALVISNWDVDTDNWHPMEGSRVWDSTDYYGGAGSLECTSQASNGDAQVYCPDGLGVAGVDLSAVKTTYLEVAVKFSTVPDYLSFQLQTDSTNKQYWIWQKSEFDAATPDANGWYICHMEMDASGLATTTGSNVNGVALGIVGGQGTLDWTDINYRYSEAQWADTVVATMNLDEFMIGEPAVPEPVTLSLVMIGGLSWMIRRRRVRG